MTLFLEGKPYSSPEEVLRNTPLLEELGPSRTAQVIASAYRRSVPFLQLPPEAVRAAVLGDGIVVGRYNDRRSHEETFGRRVFLATATGPELISAVLGKGEDGIDAPSLRFCGLSPFELLHLDRADQVRVNRYLNSPIARRAGRLWEGKFEPEVELNRETLHVVRILAQLLLFLQEREHDFADDEFGSAVGRKEFDCPGTWADRSRALGELFETLMERRITFLTHPVLGRLDETGNRLIPLR